MNDPQAIQKRTIAPCVVDGPSKMPLQSRRIPAKATSLSERPENVTKITGNLQEAQFRWPARWRTEMLRSADEHGRHRVPWRHYDKRVYGMFISKCFFSRSPVKTLLPPVWSSVSDPLPPLSSVSPLTVVFLILSVSVPRPRWTSRSPNVVPAAASAVTVTVSSPLRVLISALPVTLVPVRVKVSFRVVPFTSKSPLTVVVTSV